MRRRGTSETNLIKKDSKDEDGLSASMKRFFGKNDRSSSLAPISPQRKPNSDIYNECQIILSIKEAKNVPPLDLNGLSDPYCIIYLEKMVLYTKVIWKSLTPFWGETFKIPVSDPETADLLIEMWDKDKGKSDDAIGKISFSVKELKGITFFKRLGSISGPNINESGSSHLNGPQQKVSPSGSSISSSPSVTVSTPDSRGTSSTISFPTTPKLQKTISSSGSQLVGLAGVLRKGITDQWFTLLPIDDGKNKDAVVSGEVSFSLEYKNHKTLIVVVESGKGLASKDSNGLSDPFAVIEVGSEKKKTSVIRKTLDPVWNETFEFSVPDISKETFIITVYDWDQFGQDFMGMVSIDLDKTNLAGTSQTHELCYKPEYGQIRLSIEYQETRILPFSYYREIMDFLFNSENYCLFLLIGRCLNASGRDSFSEHLIQLTEAESKTFELISYLTKQEIVASENPDVLFRGNSLACKTLDHCMKHLGSEYLKDTLKPIIKNIYSSKKLTEIDPSKAKGKNMDLKKNLSNLIDFSTQLISTILESSDKCPTGLVKIFDELNRHAIEKFNSKEVGYRAVSSFIFLRFFCASILNPKLFDLHKDYPKGKVSRTLTLLAKIIQNLAGFIEFGGKEPYMADLNPLIVENFDRMKQYLEKISNYNNNMPVFSPPGQDPAIHSAYLLPYFWENMTQMKEEATQEELPKLMKLESMITYLDSMYNLFNLI